MATATTPAFASDGHVKVVNTETVQVYTSATGEIQTRRVYEQLALTGHGSVNLKNPISTDGLRNLDGFGGFKVVGGKQITSTTVDGEKHLRSVSNYNGKLPLDISVKYTLNGRTVDPSDVVGQSGALEVQYTVKNVTGRDQEVSIPDGNGGTVTKTVNVPIPMVGSLTTTTPGSFTNVKSGAANMAGDGQGGTKLSFTMTLFPPIGSDTAVFGYTADITNGIVPRASVSALPVNPMESPTFKSAATSYKGGADTGIELTAGATQIDANLLKLRDGAGTLLAGLLKLRDGAVQLQSGLAGQAAPGADQLADGAAALDAGLGRLGSGSKQLAAGTGTASAGAGKLAAGAEQLDSGLGQLDGGVGRLDAGATRLAAGQAQLEAGLTQMYDGVKSLPSDVREQVQKDPMYNLLIGALASTSSGADKLVTGVDGVAGTLSTQLGAVDAIAGSLPAADAVAAGQLKAIVGGLQGGLLTGPGAALPSLRAGLSNGDPAKCLVAQSTESPLDDCGIKQGAQFLQTTGIPLLVAALSQRISDQLIAGLGTAQKGCDPEKTLRCAAAALTQGGNDLNAGVKTLVDGVTKLAAGGDQLASGAGDLSAGLSRVDDGAGRLADGTGQAAVGSSQLAEGANTLAAGLGDAADGSGRLADGLGQAAAGAPALKNGAQRLSDEGTKKLIVAGKSTAQNYGELYATIKAGADRAETEDMAFGAPQGAIGLTAYSYEIKGEDGEGGRNLTRGMGGLAILGAGAGVFALRRRFL
jgi:putative membrane protein